MKNNAIHRRCSTAAWFDSWCRTLALTLIASATTATAIASDGGALECPTVATQRVPALVCGDAALIELDRLLAQVYTRALKVAARQRPPALKAEQRGWIKRRDDCGKAAEVRPCVEDSYRHRIAELQARHRLVPGSGAVLYVCDGDRSNEVMAWFFETEPRTLVAERGDASSVMFAVASGSGARFIGRDASLWEHPGETAIQWGSNTAEMRCLRQR